MMEKPLNKNLIGALTLAITNLLGVFLIFGVPKMSEVLGLTYMMHWFEGKRGFEGLWYQVFRPLAPLLAVPFGLITDEQTGLLLLNIIFYLLSAYFVFKITELVYQNQEQALLAVVLWIFAIPALIHCLSAHTLDVGAWFFGIFSVYLILLYLKKRQESLLVWSGLVTGLGMLLQENGAMGALFFLTFMLLSKERGWRDKILKLIKFGVFFSLPIIAWHAYVYAVTPFSHSYFLLLDVKTFVAGGSPMIMFFILQHGLALSATFGLLGWLLIFFGGLREWQNKNKERLRILLALVPFSLASWLWVNSDSRHAFIVGALGALLGSYGLVNLAEMIKNKKLAVGLTISVISLYVVSNYFAYYFNDSLPFFDFYGIYHFFTGIDFS